MKSEIKNNQQFRDMNCGLMHIGGMLILGLMTAHFLGTEQYKNLIMSFLAVLMIGIGTIIEDTK